MSRDLHSILLVEDDDDDALLTQLTLSRHHLNCDVKVATDGQAALDYLYSTNDTVDLILLDFHLPKVSGLEVLRSIRSHELTKALPVIILSSSQGGEMPILDSDIGPGGFLNKPIRFPAFCDILTRERLNFSVSSPT